MACYDIVNMPMDKGRATDVTYQDVSEVFETGKIWI